MLTLWVFLAVSLSTTVSAQVTIYVHGVPFQAQRLAQRDDTVLIEFADKAIFTSVSNKEREVVKYYFNDSKPLDIEKAHDLIKASVDASDFEIVAITLRRVCKLSTETKERIIKDAFSIETTKSEITDFLPEENPDPECLIFPLERKFKRTSFTLTDPDLFYAKLAVVVNSILETQNPSVIPPLASKVNSILEEHPVDSANKYSELKLLQLLYALIEKRLRNADSGSDVISAIHVKDLERWVAILWETGALNCRNFMTLMANIILDPASDKIQKIYKECIDRIFEPSQVFRNDSLIRSYCNRNVVNCEERFLRLVKIPEFFSYSKNVELAFELSNNFSPRNLRKVRDTILYELHSRENKPLLKLIETKYRESLSIGKKLWIFTRNNILKALVLSSLAIGLALFFVAKRATRNKEDDRSYSSSFVKITRVKQDSEFVRYKQLLKNFGLQPGADMKQIKKAYFELSKQYHPDTYKGDSSKFLEINETYQEILKLYDKFGPKA